MAFCSVFPAQKKREKKKKKSLKSITNIFEEFIISILIKIFISKIYKQQNWRYVFDIITYFFSKIFVIFGFKDLGFIGLFCFRMVNMARHGEWFIRAVSENCFHLFFVRLFIFGFMRLNIVIEFKRTKSLWWQGVTCFKK